MIGHQEISAGIFIISLVPLAIILGWPVPDIIKILIIASILFSFFAVLWPNYLISYNRLQPLINRIRPEEEVVWVRITKNRMLSFQVAKKGAYGQTKGIVHKHKADVVDKGDFPVRCINGNSAILVYDMMSHNVNAEHAVAWKKIFKKFKIRRGKDAYKKAKDEKKVIA